MSLESAEPNWEGKLENTAEPIKIGPIIHEHGFLERYPVKIV